MNCRHCKRPIRKGTAFWYHVDSGNVYCDNDLQQAEPEARAA